MERAKVFISYSRADGSALAEELVAGLEVAGFEPYLDTEDIEKAVDVEERLGALILKADTVVFIISPGSMRSVNCKWEVDRTVELRKRIIPVQWIRVDQAEVPEQLRRLNYIIFAAGQSFARPLAELVKALRQDVEWVRAHTRLGEQAAHWRERGQGAHADDLLLRGSELADARIWVTRRKPEAPEITDLQRSFLAASEEAESTRLGKERAQLEKMRRSQRRAGRLLWSVAVLVLAMLGYVTWKDYDVTRSQQAVFTSLAASALKDEQFDRAMRYALQTYQARGHLPWLTPISTELEGKLAGGAQSTQFQQLHHMLKGHARLVSSAAFSPDGKRVVTASFDNTARLWEADSGKEIAVLKGHTGWVQSAAFSPDGKRAVTASDDSTARLWEADSGKEIAVLEGHTGSVRSAAFSPNGKRVVTASYDDTARLWDADSGKEIAVLRGHSGSVSGAAFSPDGKRVVTASPDSTARLREADSGKEIAVLKGHTRSVRSAAFSPDGKRVATASYDNTARLWDADSGKEIAVLRGHSGSVSGAAFSPDGKRVVTASDDSTGRLWEAESGQEIAVLKGHTRLVSSAAFSPDGKRVVTASPDSTARLWDADSGKEIAALKGHTGSVRSAAFSPDGKRVVTASSESTAHIFDVTWATLVRGETLRERVCGEKLAGVAQEFSDAELDDPILRGIDRNDPIARNPCLRRGPLSLDYWTRLPGDIWRAGRKLTGRS